MGFLTTLGIIGGVAKDLGNVATLGAFSSTSLGESAINAFTLGIPRQQATKTEQAAAAERAGLEQKRVESVFAELGAAKQKQSIISGFGQGKTRRGTGLLGEQLTKAPAPRGRGGGTSGTF